MNKKNPGGRPDPALSYSNFRLAMISVVLAVFVWMLAKQNEFDTDVVNVAVNIVNVPKNIRVEYEPEHLEVSLRFPKGLRGEMLPSNFSIAVDADALELSRRAIKPGEEPNRISYPVKPGDFQVRQGSRLPEDVIDLIKFVPETIYIQSIYHGDYATVKPRFDGLPAEGYFLDRERVRVRPSEVFVTGSPESLEDARDPASGEIVVRTRAIQLAGSKSTMVLPTLDLDLPPGLNVTNQNDKYVEVSVPVEERETRRTLEGVPIRIPGITKLQSVIEPPAATLEVEGPRSLVRALSPENIQFLVLRGIEETPGSIHSNVPIEVRIVGLPGGPLQDREDELRVLEFQPTTVRIAYPEDTSTEPAP